MPDPVISPARARLDEVAVARRLLPLLDLALLDDDVSAADVAHACQRAADPRGAPAALCVWPQHIVQTRGMLDRLGRTATAVATVVNFPDGSADGGRLEHEILQALGAGVEEIDAVLPWRLLLDGALPAVADFLARCRALCGDAAKLKIIIESGALARPTHIATASRLAIEAGADFLKTSTGRAAVNATPVAADIMLETIQADGGRCGFVAAGGIRRLGQAATYLSLAEARLGAGWVTPAHFRIGASRLHEVAIAALDAQAPA